MPESLDSPLWQLTDIKTQKKINIYKPKVVVGRSKEADLVCTFIAASRNHAAFTLHDGQLRVTDLESLNGTLVNKQAIPPKIPQVLKDGDEIALGDDGEVKDQYQCFKVGKMTAMDIVTLEISDDEDQSLNETVLNKQKVVPGVSHDVLNGGNKNGKTPVIDVITVESSDDENTGDKGGPELNDKIQNKEATKQEAKQTDLSTSVNKTDIENSNKKTTCSILPASETKVTRQEVKPNESSANKADTENAKKKSTCSFLPTFETKVTRQEVEQNKPSSSVNKADTKSTNESKEVTKLEVEQHEPSSTSDTKADKENSCSSRISARPPISSYQQKEISGLEVMQDEASSSRSNKTDINSILTDFQQDQFAVKEEIVEIAIDSTCNDFQSDQFAAKPVKTEAPTSLDEEIIVIIDDDDDGAVMLSQVLAVNNSVPDENHGVTDDIFYRIKKEVEEFDKVECPQWEYPCPIDSEDENLSEIFAEELQECKENKPNDTPPPSPQPGPSTSASELDKPPNSPAPSSSSSSSAAPVPNGTASPEVFYKRPSSTMLIEAQPLKVQNSRKRKSELKKREDPTKKPKKSANLDKHSRNAPQQEPAKKRKEAEEKKKIAEMRKEKLKELATKSAENKAAENKGRVNKPKVKVSEGRGNFLLNDIEAGPSTSKAKDPVPNRSHAGPSRKRCEPPKPPPKPDRPKKTATVNTADDVKETLSWYKKNKKKLKIDAGDIQKNEDMLLWNTENQDVRVDTTEEVKEILSWNTNWLTRSEYLTLNPLVRLKKLKPLERSYSSYRDYFAMNRNLLMVELWAHIQKEFEVNRSNCVFPMFVEECIHDSQADVSRLDCITYLSKTQAESLTYVRESDLLVVDMRLSQNGRTVIKPCFAFIKDCAKYLLKNHHYINTNLAGRLKSVPHTKIAMKVLINNCPEEIKTKTIVNFKIVTSLVSHLRLFKSLRYLEYSFLIDIILKPTAKDLMLTDVISDILTSTDNLSRVQYQAVMEAVCVCSRPDPGLYLIQGPPGTGKTNIIKNIVLQLLYGKKKINHGCLLLVAPSNAAVDQLVLKLVCETKPKLPADKRKNMKLVRVGPESSIHPKVKAYCLEELSRKYLNKDLISTNAEAEERNKELQREIQHVEAEIEKLKGQNKDVPEVLRTKLDYLKNRNENFAKDILKDKYNQAFSKRCDTVLCCANIVCTTLSSCMGRRIEDNVMSGRLKFVCCIVDEATQSTEQESIIPLRLGVKRMVLVGDPQQLPATVMSSDAKTLGYGCSLFQRILKNFTNTPSKPLKMLTRQYRMHPEICDFPNKQYYGGRLETSFSFSKPLQSLHPFLIFSLNVAFNSHRKQETYKNTDEACFIHKLIEVLLETIPHRLNVTVGIITPYQNQRAAINSMLKSLNRGSHLSIECNTVDGFQGQETDITILSCVREDANTFLNDAHRLNVALTRAKYALYVVGTKSLFDSCAELAKLRQNAEERRLFKDGTRLKCSDLKRVLWR